jgi:hypothetical protein
VQELLKLGIGRDEAEKGASIVVFGGCCRRVPVGSWDAMFGESAKQPAATDQDGETGAK